MKVLTILIACIASSVHSQGKASVRSQGKGPRNKNALRANEVKNDPPPAAPAVQTKVPCNATVQRHEVREMKAAGALDAYIAAFKAMAGDGSLAKYVNIHVDNWSFAHFSPNFLPFHRCYLKQFELEIIAHGGSYIPYWDHATDSQSPWESLILSDDYFGSIDPSNHNVKDGPFAGGNYTAPVGGNVLIRDYDPTNTPAFYAQSLIDATIVDPLFSRFARQLEYGPHASVHSILGGKKGDLSSPKSPNDPIFWIHHAFMDKLWADQQAKYGYKFEGSYYKAKADPNALIQPWGIPLSACINPKDVCSSYAQQDRTIVKTLNPDSGIVKEPGFGENWFNNTGVNQQFAEDLAGRTELAVENIRSKNSGTNHHAKGMVILTALVVLVL